MRKQLLALVALLIVTWQAPAAVGACISYTFTDASQTGDSLTKSFFNIDMDDVHRLEDDFNIVETDFRGNQFTLSDLNNPNHQYRRLLNALLVLGQLNANGGSQTWYHVVKETFGAIDDIYLATDSECGDDHSNSNAWFRAGLAGGDIFLTKKILLQDDVLVRASTIVHESRHNEKSHEGDDRCQQGYRSKLSESPKDCDPSWGFNGALTYQSMFLFDAGQNPSFFQPTVMIAALNKLNQVLSNRFESIPTFRVAGFDGGNLTPFQKVFWDCSGVRSFDCPDTGGWEWNNPETESAYFGIRTDLAKLNERYLIVSIGVGMRHKTGAIRDDIQTIAIRRRWINNDGSLAPIGGWEYFGRTPTSYGVQRWVELTPNPDYNGIQSVQQVVTGVIVHSNTTDDADGIISLGVKYAYYDPSTGYVGKTVGTKWGTSTHTTSETNIRVADYHVLTGLGLSATNRNVLYSAFNQSLPLFTRTVGGYGGSPNLVRCPIGYVAVGVETSTTATQTTGTVGMLGLICMPVGSVRSLTSPSSIDYYVAHSSYRVASTGLVVDAGIHRKSQMNWPDAHYTHLCPNGSALAGLQVRSGALIDRIERLRCVDMTTSYALYRSRTVNVGGTGGGSQKLFCDEAVGTFTAIDGMHIRSGWSLDRLSVHCKQH